MGYDWEEEQHLQDAVEDAQTSLRSYKRGLRVVVLLSLMCAALIVLGVYMGTEGALHHVDTSGWAAASIAIGGLGIVVIGVFCCVVISDENKKCHPEVELRQALRAQRAYYTRQSYRMTDSGE